MATVEIDKGKATMHVKVLDGQGAIWPGTLAREYSRPLSGAEWDRVSEALKTGFWGERSVQQPDVRTHDGSGCLIALLNLTFEDIPVTEFEELVHD